MKQETQFSLFRELTTSKPSGTVTLAEVYRLITTDATLKENTEKFRYFKQQGFDADADKIKRSRCLAFTPAVLFDGNRGKKNIVAYTQCSLVDIDGLEEEQAERLVQRPPTGARLGIRVGVPPLQGLLLWAARVAGRR